MGVESLLVGELKFIWVFFKRFFSSDSQHDDVSLYNLFSDHNIIPIEINIERDLTQFDLIDIFEKLKRKIGDPCTYELSNAEKLEIEKIKKEIAEKEKLEREAEERLKAEEERAEKEKQIEDWVTIKKIFKDNSNVSF